MLDFIASLPGTVVHLRLRSKNEAASGFQVLRQRLRLRGSGSFRALQQEARFKLFVFINVSYVTEHVNHTHTHTFM